MAVSRSAMVAEGVLRVFWAMILEGSLGYATPARGVCGSAADCRA